LDGEGVLAASASRDADLEVSCAADRLAEAFSERLLVGGHRRWLATGSGSAGTTGFVFQPAF
jgi:hypothetical protein